MTHINFDIENAELMEDDPASRFAYAKIQAFSSGPNRHNLICDVETLERTAPTIYNTPILYNIVGITGDFGTHSDPGKSMITGFVVPDSAEFSELPDGRTSLNIIARIFKRYVPKVMELFSKHNERKVSVEMDLMDSRDVGNGLTQMLDFIYTGIQILGTTVREASPGANMQFLSFSEAKKEYDEALRLEFGKYEDIDFTIPETIKSTCMSALELHKQYGGATSVALASARNVIKNSAISPDRVRNIHKYLDSHKNKPKNKSNPDGAYISYMLHGGDEALEWSKSIVEKLDSYDNKLSSYFSETVTFPYTSEKDMNPALKGIDPPISLGQANEIARQADAIGADKGGWGIAISSFKKRHKVKDGHWVKMSEEENEMEFAKEDLGKGESLKVDKSKDKVSDSPWGNVDKTSLQHKILNASNYSSLVHDVYMIVESGWEDAPSQHLKYPVMQVSGGTLVYNKHGLSAALGRAKQQGENAVVSKVNSIMKKLGLDNPTKEEMSVEDPKEVKNAEEEMAAPVAEMAAESPADEKKEDPKEEAKETPEQEKKEEGQDNTDNKKEMSLDSNLDMAAVLAMLDDDTEGYRELADAHKNGIEVNYAALCNCMYAKMCKMSEKYAELEKQSGAYMAELMSFKERDFAVIVESVLNDVSDALSKDDINAAREDSKNFSLDTVDAWKNKTKALAFSAVKQQKPANAKKGYALPFTAEQKKERTTIWG